jgi:hypothetical protein
MGQREGVRELIADRKRRAGALLGAALTLVLVSVVSPGVAGAHNAGRVELLVTDLKFNHEGHGTGAGVKVSADLVDRDSGASAGGFAIVVSAVGPDGHRAGPVTLTDPGGTGHYEGVLAIMPGAWTVTAKAEQGTSALPALGSTRSARVTFDDTGVVTEGRGGGGSNLGLWVALVAAGFALGLGGLLVVTRRPAAPATTPIGQRV